MKETSNKLIKLDTRLNNLLQEGDKIEQHYETEIINAAKTNKLAHIEDFLMDNAEEFIALHKRIRKVSAKLGRYLVDASIKEIEEYLNWRKKIDSNT